jgi:hypothetical protein
LASAIAEAEESEAAGLMPEAAVASRSAAVASAATRRFLIWARNVSSVEARTMSLMSALISWLILASAASSAVPISGMNRSCMICVICSSRSRLSFW